MTSHLGIDCSKWQHILPWAEWRDRLEIIVIQTTHGLAPDPWASTHLANARRAGYTVIGAYHYLMPGNATVQAGKFISSLLPLPAYSFAALDVEQEGVTAQDILDWCAAFGDELPLVLYGNNQLAAIIAAHPELRKYGVWWANYPLGTARISAPPPGTKPSAPAGLNVVAWQFSGTGLLPPYADDIDMSEWYHVPGVVTPPDPAAEISRLAVAVRDTATAMLQELG